MTRTLFTIAAAGAFALGLAQAAVASTQITDAQYIAAARCQALTAAPQLGGGDRHAFDQFMRAQSVGRVPDAEDRAQEAHDRAEREASRAGPYAREALIAERDGACRALVQRVEAMQPAPMSHGR